MVIWMLPLQRLVGSMVVRGITSRYQRVDMGVDL